MKIQQKNSTENKFNICEKLRKNGLKVTPVRIAIIEFLKKESGPFTIQEVYQGIKHNKLKSFNIATIYRNMEKFVNAKLVSECQLSDGTSRFEIQLSTHHHHLVCVSCKRIDPMFYCPVKIKIPDSITKGYRNISHKLEFYGICPNC